MRRTTSPLLRPSPDTGPNSKLRRSSGDVYRPNRLAKLKNASVTSSASSTTNNGPGRYTSLKRPLSYSRAGCKPALRPSTKSSTTSSKANPSLKSVRDMHRHGANPAQVVSPAITAAASASSLSLASTAPLTNSVSNAGATTMDPWHMLHVHVLPLFNGEPLRIAIEVLNQLVKKHISSVASRSLPRAIGTLEQDVSALLATGMITLNVKLSELDDEKLLIRVSEVWEFFWHQVLPYVQGVFHPLQTDKLILSLSRTPKTQRTASPTLPEPPTASPPSIDVRILALRSFRDSIILPIYPRLHELLSSPRKDLDPDEKPPYSPRLQQMFLVLVSTARHSASVTTASASPSQGESAMVHLLRAMRSPHATAPSRPLSVTRLPSFFAGSAPRDRRGRVARKSMRYTTLNLTGATAMREDGLDGQDDETPRNAGFGEERDRERAFLESLRSPTLVTEELGSVDEAAGGWGLGMGQEHQGEEDEEDDEAMDWEQAQDVVERMVGLRA